ncbi:unnamed protein product [Calypogeia fissa]
MALGLRMRVSSWDRIMAGKASLLTLHSDPIQVPWCRWTYPHSPGLHSRNSCKAGTAALRTGRRSVFTICAAKPGFGAQPKKRKKKSERKPKVKEEKDPVTRAKQILAKKEQTLQKESGGSEQTLQKEAGGSEQTLQNEAASSEEAPSLLIDDEWPSYDPEDDELFEKKLEEIKRVAAEQKKMEEQKKYAPIDYDAPLPSSSSTPNSWTDNLGAKIGIGVAVVVFGLIFAFGDFLPSSPTAEKSSLVEKKQLTKEQTSKLEAQVQEFEGILKDSPEDRSALEGAAVSYAELGEYDKAEKYLTKITQKSPGNADVFRLLAEVQSGKGDLDGSISSYRAAIQASGKKESFALLQGLTDTLLAAKKPSEAVGELLAARARLQYKFDQIKSQAKQAILPSTSGDISSPGNLKGEDNTPDIDEQIDPITLELLLGKAYAAWDGHTSDAATVYDGLIKNYPEDYRGFLAKGVLLKTQNKQGDAERMFIQARYLAPANSKSIVDIYSGRRPS